MQVTMAHWHSYTTLSTHVVTVGSRVALGRRQVGTQDGVVEDVQVGRHTVVAFVVV